MKKVGGWQKGVIPFYFIHSFIHFGGRGWGGAEAEEERES